MTTFESLGLDETILRAVRECGYSTPTPVQEATIPAVIAGKDVTGCAQTGTGKTAAFVLPTLHRLVNSGSRPKNRKGFRPVRALVIAPTRELAGQIDESVRSYGKGLGLRSLTIYGGVGMGPQINGLKRGVDIVIATPGRLLDHLTRGRLDLSRVESLILDEADRMFDMGFINDIRTIVERLPRERQTLLFSATMPKAIRSLSESIQRKPEFIEIGNRRDPAASVSQSVYGIPQEGKVDLLLHLIAAEEPQSLLVFTRTKHRADRLARQLNRGKISAVAIHSNRSQAQRKRALEDFRSGRQRVLVATDVASRGLDVDNISHVVNFDVPGSPEDYIHRIGRTGRASSTGTAITFVSRNERGGLAAIERTTGRQIERGEVEGMTEMLETGRRNRPNRRNDRRDDREERGSDRPSRTANSRSANGRSRDENRSAGKKKSSSSRKTKSRARRSSGKSKTKGAVKFRGA